MNSYKFYSNNECQYFPCHKVKREEDFNCMFCYCPLYLVEECGGNHTMHKNIKDCSNCLIPHSNNGYDYINKKLMEIIDMKRKKGVFDEGDNDTRNEL